MISNHLTMIESRRNSADSLSQQVARHLDAGGRIQELESPPINPEPAKRSEKIDPETKLKRRRPPMTVAERRALRAMTEEL